MKKSINGFLISVFFIAILFLAGCSSELHKRLEDATNKELQDSTCGKMSSHTENNLFSYRIIPLVRSIPVYIGKVRGIANCYSFFVGKV